MGLQGSFYICAFFALALATTALPLSASLISPYYYDKTCPNALETIKSAVEEAVRKERRMGASLLRLHFHDCFVLGCDASILLDPAPTIDSEKNAIPNKGSIRGFEVIDEIKSRVDKACGKPVVSCADIVAVAARDSVVALGGPTWQVPLGRRDSTTASRTLANRDIPSPFLDLPGLIDNFKRQGLDVKDLVALSGGHTLGFARCKNFRERIYNETNIDPIFARQRQATCPRKGHDGNLAPLDPTPALFDTKYFSSLVMRRGLLHSDQELFKYGGQTDWLVSAYSRYAGAFSKDFVESMIKMGNIKLLTGTQGQIRVNCRKVNSHV